MDDFLLRFRPEKRYVFVDFETQNLCLNECHNLPWQCAMLFTDNKRVIKKVSFYIKWNPLLKVSKDAARITGYREDLVAKYGYEPLRVARLIRRWIEKADYVVGHNFLGFDYYVANSLFRKVGLGIYDFVEKVIDTNAIIRGLKLNYLKSPLDSLIEYQFKLYHHKQKGLKTSLGVVAKEYGVIIDESKLHDAAYDLMLNFEVFKKLLFQVEL